MGRVGSEGTPKDVVDKLHGEMVRIMAMPAIRQKSQRLTTLLIEEAQRAGLGIKSPLDARRTKGVWTGKEMIVDAGAVGGDEVTGNGEFAFADGAAYNPATDTWRSIKDGPAHPGFVPIWTGTYMVLFAKGSGESTDIVQKEMYAFTDKGGERITLRPEATPSMVRAYVEHSLEHALPFAKLFSMGQMFRYERPQKGRYRQFHQIGIELIGPGEPLADAEVIACGWDILKALGVSSEKRVPILPDVPAVNEEIPGYEVATWYGVFAPVQVPKTYVPKLNQTLTRIFSTSDARQRLSALGADPITLTPDQFNAAIRKETAKWAKVIKESGARPD
mgnify:CR=1 FL=1